MCGIETPPKEVLQNIKDAFPKGADVELVHMEDPYRVMPVGLKGKVDCVDGIGTIHVNWENGSSLGVIWKEDCVKNLATGVLSSRF